MIFCPSHRRLHCCSAISPRNSSVAPAAAAPTSPVCRSSARIDDRLRNSTPHRSKLPHRVSHYGGGKAIAGKTDAAPTSCICCAVHPPTGPYLATFQRAMSGCILSTCSARSTCILSTCSARSTCICVRRSCACYLLRLDVSVKYGDTWSFSVDTERGRHTHPSRDRSATGGGGGGSGACSGNICGPGGTCSSPVLPAVARGAARWASRMWEALPVRVGFVM